MKKKYHRVGFSAAQSAELWDRWRKGESLSAIGREFGKSSSSVFATAIRVMDEGTVRPAGINCHSQGIDNQVPAHPMAHGPTHDAT